MNNNESFISSMFSQAQIKFQQKKFKEASDLLSLILTKNYKILSFRAKVYYYQSEYYKSLNDCQECISLSLNDNNINNIEIYQLSVLNHIKMYDLESAKEKLKQCEKIDKKNPKNSELLSLIEEEEKKMKRIAKNIVNIQFI